MLRSRRGSNYYTMPHNHGLPYQYISAVLRRCIDVDSPDEVYLIHLEGMRDLRAQGNMGPAPSACYPGPD